MKRWLSRARLVRLTPLLAMVAPFVIFGFLYVLAVLPQRAAAQGARGTALSLRDELARRRVLIGSTPPATTIAPATPAVDRRTPDIDGARDVAAAVTRLANGPAVGGVTNRSTRIAGSDVAVTFEADQAQIGRFFLNLRALPAIFELRSFALSPAGGSLKRVRMVLFVFKPAATAAPSPGLALAPAQPAPAPQVVHVSPTPRASTTPERRPNSAGAEPSLMKVSSILISDSRRVALVDGRIVRTGDRLGSFLVGAIDRDGVVLVADNGARQRVGLERPVIRVSRQ